MVVTPNRASEGFYTYAGFAAGRDYLIVLRATEKLNRTNFEQWLAGRFEAFLSSESAGPYERVVVGTADEVKAELNHLLS